MTVRTVPADRLTDPRSKYRAVGPERSQFRRLGVLGLLLLASTTANAFATNIPRQIWLDGIEDSLADLWDKHVLFGVGGSAFAGVATVAAADGGPGFWAGEGGGLCDSPLWNFENSTGTPGLLFVYAEAYEKTGNLAQLRRARYLGDTLVLVGNALGGGWFQDGAIINNTYRNVGVWGAWGNRRHAPDFLQGIVTLDDSTSQTCALALIKLYQSSPDPRYLDAAMRFADRLVALPDEVVDGRRPYANGGFPQLLPVAVALSSDYNQNQDPRNPDGPYMAHKQNNDSVMADALIMLMELYRVSNQPRYLQAIRLTVDYLLERHAAYGYRGWAQQYHYQDDRIAWGRFMEPPAFTTTELNIIPALTIWWHRETEQTRRDQIALSMERYARWLRGLPRPAQYPNRIWRYYNHDESAGLLDSPVFADDYVRYVGAQYEAWAGHGQDYTGEYDLLWATRMFDGQDRFDLARLTSYLPEFVEAPFDVVRGSWLPTPEQPSAAVPRQYMVNGQPRLGLEVRGALISIHSLVNRTNIVGAASDRDSDDYADSTEFSLLSDHFDSDDIPWREVGDCNCDGHVTIGDIPAFVLTLTSIVDYIAQYPECSTFRADANGDGAINAGDIGAFVALLTE